MWSALKSNAEHHVFSCRAYIKGHNAQLRLLVINHRDVIFRSIHEKSNVSHKPAQITDLQSQSDGEQWCVLTLPTCGGSQRVHDFKYGALWEHTHPHGDMNREQKPLGAIFKQPAKYCTWSRLHIQQRPFKHYLNSVLVMTVAPTCSFYVWVLISWMGTLVHLNYTCMQMHVIVCHLLKQVCFSPFTVSQCTAVFVPHMVSLQGTKPQAARTKCQLSLNAVTFLKQICFF